MRPKTSRKLSIQVTSIDNRHATMHLSRPVSVAMARTSLRTKAQHVRVVEQHHEIGQCTRCRTHPSTGHSLAARARVTPYSPAFGVDTVASWNVLNVFDQDRGMCRRRKSQMPHVDKLSAEGLWSWPHLGASSSGAFLRALPDVETAVVFLLKNFVRCLSVAVSFGLPLGFQQHPDSSPENFEAHTHTQN